MELNKNIEISGNSIVNVEEELQNKQIAYKQALEQSESNKPENVGEQISYLLPIENENSEMNFLPSRRKTTRRITVSIKGKFSIKQVQLLKDRMIHILENFDYVDFKLRDISEIDLPAIQLLFVVKNIATNKNINIDAEFTKEDKLMIRNSGFQEIFSQQNTSPQLA